MKIGIPKEVKNHEDRVAATPDNVRDLVGEGHEVLVEAGAGLGSSFSDEAYQEAGARLVSDLAELWAADMVLKVKEPQESEYQYLRPGLILMTYLHLADNEPLVKVLVESGTNAIAYETVQEEDGSLPLLSPMSEVAGRAAIQIGAHYLEKQNGGKGILLSGVPGTEPGKVVVIGGGTVGYNAARSAAGMGAHVAIMDNNPSRLRVLDELLGSSADVIMSNPTNIARQVKDADLVIGSVLIAGHRAPVLVTEEMVKSMEPGSVLIDVAIDQGGNFETSDHATNHDEPVYICHGVVHYTVPNIPGAVPQTATCALTNATMGYVSQIAGKGLEEAAKTNPAIKAGINTYQGKLVSAAVAETSSISYSPLDF